MSTASPTDDAQCCGGGGLQKGSFIDDRIEREYFCIERVIEEEEDGG